MTHTVFVTGADRGLGLALCAEFLNLGWQVFAGQFMPAWPELSTLAGQYPEELHIVPLDVSSEESVRAAAQTVASLTDHIDVLINNAGIHSFERPIREPQEYTEMHHLYDVNALGPLRAVKALLFLTDRGGLKRLCFVSSEAGSITRAERTAEFGYCMSKAALNMGVKILFNGLHRSGYTFRVYHPGWIRSYMLGEKDMAASLEPEQAAVRAITVFLSQQEDEDRLALLDFEGKEWPW